MKAREKLPFLFFHVVLHLFLRNGHFGFEILIVGLDFKQIRNDSFYREMFLDRFLEQAAVRIVPTTASADK